MSTYNLISFSGIFFLMAFAWILSANRKVINWRVIIWGTILQLIFAFFIFVVPAGSKAFLVLNDAVVKVLDSATAGTKFLFGRLALPPGTRNDAGEESLGFFLAFQALPTIIFFASLMALLYYAGIMPRLIKFFSKVFTKLMRISGAEALSVSSNTFVGVESNMTVLPYLGGMTRSEFCTFRRDVDDRIKRSGSLCLPPSKTISDNSRSSCFGIRPVCDRSDRDVEDNYA